MAPTVVGAAVSQPAASSVSSGALLDQNNPSRASACGYTGWMPDDWTHWAAQTFTAGRSGELTELVVWLRERSAHVSVAIVPVDADGKPIIATPIASTGMAFDSPRF